MITGHRYWMQSQKFGNNGLWWRTGEPAFSLTIFTLSAAHMLLIRAFPGSSLKNYCNTTNRLFRSHYSTVLHRWRVNFLYFGTSPACGFCCGLIDGNRIIVQYPSDPPSTLCRARKYMPCRMHDVQAGRFTRSRDFFWRCLYVREKARCHRFTRQSQQ